MLDDAAVIENDDLVGAGHRGQAVGDDDTCTFGQQVIDGALDTRLGGRIESRGGFIEDHETGILEEHAGEHQQLRFPGRQTTVAALQLRVEAFGQGREPFGEAHGSTTSSM